LTQSIDRLVVAYFLSHPVHLAECSILRVR